METKARVFIILTGCNYLHMPLARKEISIRRTESVMIQRTLWDVTASESMAYYLHYNNSS